MEIVLIKNPLFDYYINYVVYFFTSRIFAMYFQIPLVFITFFGY